MEAISARGASSIETILGRLSRSYGQSNAIRELASSLNWNALLADGSAIAIAPFIYCGILIDQLVGRAEHRIGCVGSLSNPTEPIASLRWQYILSQGFLRALFKSVKKPADDTGLTRRHRQFTNVTPPCGVNSSKPFLLYPLPFQFLPLALFLRPDSLQLLLDGSGLDQACNELTKLLLQFLSLAVAPAFSDRL